MATSSERAQKAAKTRAKNAEIEQLKAQKLAKETEGGRRAKQRALQNAVWKKKGRHPQNKADSDTGDDHLDKQGQKKRKHKKRKKSETNEDEYDSDEEQEQPVRKARKSQRAPSAAAILTDDSDQEISKKSSKGSSKGRPVASVVTSKQKVAKGKAVQPAEDSGSSSDDSEKKIDASESSSSEEDEELDDEKLRNELPTITNVDHHKDRGGSTRSRSTDLGLFKMRDSDVEMISRPSSRMSSRSGTAPPLTDFEDRTSGAASEFDEDEDNAEEMKEEKKMSKRLLVDETSEDSDDIASVIRQKRHKPTANGRRAEAFAAEQPKIRSSISSSCSKKPKTSSARKQEDKWPIHARLVLPSSGKDSDLGLHDQPPIIQSIIRKAIQNITDEMVLKQAWPEAQARPIYRKTILLDACRFIISRHDESDPEVEDVKRRIKKDERFSKVLSNLAIDRLSTLRFPAKREAEKHIPHYKLGLGEECEARVQWQPKRDGPYLNQAIIDTLKAAFFSKPSSIGNQYLDKFTSILPEKPDERELSIPLVALCATGVYAGLYEYRSGFHKELSFSGNTFIKAYSTHVKSLEKLKAGKPTLFHEIMSKLYKLVVTVSRDDGIASDNDIFSIIDL
ncbi:hypothetical protein BDZ97DRAFT_1930154 [Flammula alnicola]|nr:hypothetical protein BDZ97DRAFT_1930154 [Flammula alnicola]